MRWICSSNFPTCTAEIMKGRLLIPGLAEGVLRMVTFPSAGPSLTNRRRIEDAEAEVEHYRHHTDAMAAELDESARQLERRDLTSEAEILRAHALLVRDESLQRDVERAVRESLLQAEVAVAQAFEAVAMRFEQLEYALLAERATDLRDLAARLQHRLATGTTDRLFEAFDESEDTILATEELLPSLVLKAADRRVRGFVVVRGTPTSHAAILARSFGFPVLLVPDLTMLHDHEGRPTLIDADRGELLIDPAPGEAARRSSYERVTPRRPDHAPLQLWLSIVTPSQLTGVDWKGIEGIGLYRTETLFMEHPDGLPSEEEQVHVYGELFERCTGRPVTVRTLDIGGDKTLPHFSPGPQDNPFLGLRAHRVFHYHPEILITQLRAILRAAHGYDGLRLLFPMIESLDAWHFVQSLLEEAVASLQAEGRPYQSCFEQGVLVETPSAVWAFPGLLKHVDFASIGTNDLVQYLFAVDRTSPNVGHFYRPEHPIVLQVLQRLAEQAQAAAKPLSMCGEMGSEPHLLPLLAGLGIPSVSIALGQRRRVEEQLARLSLSDCRALAAKSLQANTADEVRALLGTGPDEQERPSSSPTMSGTAIDPVCHMAVHSEGNPFATQHGGEYYYFCSRRCLLHFLQHTS